MDGPSKSEARKYTRALNKEDQRQVEMIGKRSRIARKINKTDSKAARLITKEANKILDKEGKNVNKDSFNSLAENKKLRKLAEKRKSLEKRAEIINKSLSDSEARTWSTIAKLSESGYDVSSKKIMRDAARGERLLAYELGGIPGLIIYNSSAAGKETIVEGNKFKVRPAKGEKGSITFDNRDLTKGRDASKAREDAINDVSAITQIGREKFDSNAKPGVGNLNGKAGVRNNDLVKSAVGNAVNKKGGMKVSKEYADEYNKTYDEAVGKARNMADNNQLKKPGYVEKAEGRRPVFRTGSKKSNDDYKKQWQDYKKQRKKEDKQELHEITIMDAHDQRMSGKKVSDIAKDLKVSESTVKRYLKEYNNNVSKNALRAEALKRSGYTNAEIAKKLGVSTSTVSSYLN